MAHAQKPDFVFLRNGRVHLNRGWGTSIQSTTCSRGVRISGSNAGYTMFRGSVKGTGYPLNSPVSPFTSPPVRHRVSSHFNWTLLCVCFPHIIFLLISEAWCLVSFSISYFLVMSKELARFINPQPGIPGDFWSSFPSPSP